MQIFDTVETWGPRLISLAVPGVFLVMLAFWGAAAVILEYHWRHYGPNRQTTLRFRICFYSASLACIAAAAVAQMLYFT